MKTSDAVSDFLTWCAVHGYSEGTLRARRYYLASFVAFLDSRELFDVSSVTPSVLDSYQRYLYHQKKANGLPRSFRTQAQRLIPVKGLFAWLTRTGELSYDPSISLALPKVEHRVPEAVLSIDEVDAILAGPDTTTPLGLRDRAVLDVFYSTAIRRAELLHLRVADVDHARRTLFVRQGKGARDRFVPIGERACHWVQRYLDEGPTRTRAWQGAPCALSQCHRWRYRARCDVTARERLHPRGRSFEERRLSSLSSHDGNVDARRGGRRALHCRDARAPEARDHDDLHKGVNGETPRSALALPPGGKIALSSRVPRSRRSGPLGKWCSSVD
jgi:site-specific recombinase XerD